MPFKSLNFNRGRSRSPPSAGELTRRDILFKKKLQSIRDYIFILEENPEEANRVEVQWEKNFYKDELKAAISINFSLVKLAQEKDKEISDLMLQVSQLKQKYRWTIQSDSCLTAFPNQNSQLEANRKPSTPKRHIENAFQAEKRILGAKLSQEKEEFKKIIGRKEEVLKSNKEENIFLREQLLRLGQKVTSLEQQNVQLRRKNNRFHKKSSSETEKPESGQIGRILNFSPIEVRQEDNQNQIDFEFISFKNLQTPDKSDQELLLGEEIKQLDKIIEFQSEERVQKVNREKSVHQIKQLQEDYLVLKQQLTQAIREVEKYRVIVASLEEDLAEKTTPFQENLLIIRAPHSQNQRQVEQSNRTEDCTECLKLKAMNKTIQGQLELEREAGRAFKLKLQKMAKLSQKQQEEWTSLLSEVEMG